MDLLALELLLPLHVVLDFGSQSGSLALVVEIHSVDGIVVGIHGDESIDASPESHTLHGINGLLLAVDFALVVLLAVYLAFLLHHLLVFGGGSLVVEVTKVEGVEDLLLRVECHVGILCRLQHL